MQDVKAHLEKLRAEPPSVRLSGIWRPIPGSGNSSPGSQNTWYPGRRSGVCFSGRPRRPGKGI